VSGAGGGIGIGRVARAAPDGYTVSIGQLNSHIFSGAVYKSQFDLLRDFEPVALITAVPLMLAGRRDLPANDMAGLVAWLKANPGKATFATVGVSSPGHVWGIPFQRATGTTLQFIPYRGAAPVIQDVLAGRIDLTTLDASILLPHVRGGQIRAYAVLAETRWAKAPDIPAIGETGIAGTSILFWYGLWVPKGTPKDIIGKLDGAIIATLADPVTRQRLAELGQEIYPPEQQTPEALDAWQKLEIAKWWPMIEAAHITSE
jgi:tripartite-type tricarboxylate transporter receptor subunit TctC